MPRPELLAKLRDILTSLLLALAVSLAWPAMAAPHNQHAHPAAHHLAAAHAQGAMHAHMHHDPTLVCPPDMGCCVMTHCHPGVAQPPLDMPHAGLFPTLEPSTPTDEAGFDPAILEPPPRPLLV